MLLRAQVYFDRYGSVFKMCFGPKSFMVVTDPVIAKHILRDNVKGYDKGALSLVLEDIMGKGLIPADPETWAKRRRAIAPGFHKLYLARMVDEFGMANANLIPLLLEASKKGTRLDMEERYGSLALDVIGKAVFNYVRLQPCPPFPPSALPPQSIPPPRPPPRSQRSLCQQHPPTQ